MILIIDFGAQYSQHSRPVRAYYKHNNGDLILKGAYNYKKCSCMHTNTGWCFHCRYN
jgi:hypothetical protein